MTGLRALRSAGPAMLVVHLALLGVVLGVLLGMPLEAAAAPPSPTPLPTPTATSTPTPAPSPVPSPSPSPKGDITLSPTAAPPDARITVTGSGFDPSAPITIVFDGGDPPLASLSTTASGAFSQTVVIPDGAVADHTICARTPNGDRCAGFRLLPRPSPSPSPSPSPTPAATPSPSESPTTSPALPVYTPPAAGNGTSALAFVTRPPFVFFPLLLLAGLIGWLAYYLWGLRPPPQVQNVTVVHRAAQVREYTPEAPPPPPVPLEPVAPPELHTPAPPPPPTASPGEPSAADVPPDLPAPSD